MSSGLKWRIALGLVLVFLAGAATGLFAGAWHLHHSFSARHGRMTGDRMREHLKRELDLTPAQVKEIDPILEETNKRLQAIRAETGERVSETVEESHRALARHLTPEQIAKLEKMKQRHLGHLHHHGRHRGRDEPPAPPPDAP